MAKLTVEPRLKVSKQTCGQLVQVNGTNKHAKKTKDFDFNLVFNSVLKAGKGFFSHVTFLLACTLIFKFLIFQLFLFLDFHPLFGFSS